MSDADNILTAEGLHKSYGSGDSRQHVLRGLGLTVRRGEFLAVMGPSGCGKSTLLHVLGMMTPADDGRIVLDGAEIVEDSAGRQAPDAIRNELRRHKIGFIFQRFNLLSVLSARDNVKVSLQVRGLRYDGRCDELFEAMGVAHLRRRKPGEMSIGEQQRVAVVRALAHRPAILMADEPTGSLDSDNADAILALLRRINEQERQTIVMITHSADAAARADRTVYMKDGRIV